MASSQLKNHLPLLQYMSRGKPGIVKALIRESGPDLVKAICECAYNTLKGNVPLTPAQYRKLRRYKKHLRTLADRKKSQKVKKRTLQSGGFLGALLSTILPAVTGLIGGLVNRR